MRRPNRRAVQLVSLAIALALFLPASVLAPSSSAAPPVTRWAVPIGADYRADTLQRFAQAAVAHDTSGRVVLLVLPITYATDAYSITPGERKKNLGLADTRRGQIETACNVVRTAAQTCHAILLDTQTRGDSFRPENVTAFTTDVDGMYVLGGDQTIAMLAVADTPLEQTMAGAYGAGVAIGGNSAGAAVESVTMIAGYVGNNGPENGLQRGTVDIWGFNGSVHDPSRGLIFGLDNAVLDQHEFQRGRIARLINTSFTTGLLGIGADTGTAAAIRDEQRLTDVIGESAAFVVDPFTYAATGTFHGPTDTLAIHSVALHVLPPGGAGYDIVHRLPTTAGTSQPPPSLAGRSLGGLLTVPPGAAPLFAGGGLTSDRGGLAASRFVAAAGGSAARLVVIATGYARSTDAQAEAKAEAAALQAKVGSPVAWYVMDARASDAAIAAAVDGATGVWLTAPDQSTVGAALAAHASVVDAIHAGWSAGRLTTLFDDAAAATVGPLTSADPTPTASNLESVSVEDFRIDGVVLRPGLGWLGGASIEPRVLPDRHWGRLFNLLRAAPGRLGVGIDLGTAIELGPDGAAVRGTSAAVVLDGRFATFADGSNGVLGASWVVIDTFADGDDISP